MNRKIGFGIIAMIIIFTLAFFGGIMIQRFLGFPIFIAITLILLLILLREVKSLEHDDDNFIIKHMAKNKEDKQQVYTPEHIDKLRQNEIFVFGSNLNGWHGGGAALIAHERFGAKLGISEGFTGKTYAIPTLDENMEKVSVEELAVSLSRFFVEVKNHQEYVFYLTKIGCGIAGWSVEEVRRIFWLVVDKFTYSGNLPNNLIIPKEFK